MKQLKQYILLMLMAATMVSCVWEDVKTEFDEEGRPVTLNLDFVSMASDEKKIITRGGDNHDINDLYILIFSSDNGKPGVLKNKLYTTELTKTNASIPNDKGTSTTSTTTRVTTPIQTTTGESFIFAFANISSTYAPAEYDVSSLKGQLDALKIGEHCYDELMDINIPLRTTDFTSLQRVTDSYLLAGMYQNDGEYTRANTPCMIDDSGTLSGGTIRMYRLDSRIDFRIISDLSSESKGTFVPTAWRLYNVPIKSRLMTTAYNTGEDFDGKSPIYTTDAGVAENYWNTEDMTIDAEGSEYVFSFYMLENRKEPTAAGKSLGTWEYRHREIMTPLTNADGTTSTEGNLHSFAYAPKYATYLEFDGYFTGVSEYPFGSNEKDGAEHPITATSQYRIHLGDFGSNVSGQGHTLNDFNTLRNYHYTYTITIKGVEQIIVEVNKTEEELPDMETPGMNGVVSYLPENSHRVDSHFETRSIRIRKEDLANWTEEDFKYLAQTCYGDYEGTKGTGTPRDDIYWVEFALTYKQDKDGSWKGWHIKENGSQNYPDGVPMAGRTEQHPAYMNYYFATCQTNAGTEGKLMYVNEFLQSLWDWKNAPEDANDDIHWNIQEKIYTIYIKENYYSNEDIAKFDRQKNATGTSDEYHWKDFCNQPERVMYIGMNKIESAQTESAIMENICVARQRSIQTIYNTDHKYGKLTSAWGIETVDELRGTLTKGFDVAKGVTRTSKDTDSAPTDFEAALTNGVQLYFNMNNGYIAQYYFLWSGWRMYTTGTANEKPETRWGKYVLQTTHDAMKDATHNRAFFECLSRNRDLDGDGFIDPGEIRWYLPALNQLGDVFIGERGIEPEATLYYGQTAWNHEYQYLTATIRNEAGNYTQYKVLAEEGFAYNASEAFAGSQTFYNVRCVRNLGVNGDTNYKEGFYDKNNVSNSLTLLLNNFDEPQQYVQVNENDRTMDLTYLNDKSKRGFVNTELTAEHTERSDENQLYNKFQWADGAVTASRGTLYSSTSTSYRRFSGDEVAYGERNITSMRTLTRASLYPNDLPNTVQQASDSPQQGWRAPNQKELMLLHFHAKGFRAGTTHTSTNADGGNDHDGYNGANWFFCRTCFTYGGMKANRDWRDWTSNWITNATSIDYGAGGTQNQDNWYRYDKTNRSPGNLNGSAPKFTDYRYAFGIQHNGTGFGLLYLDYYMQNNITTKYCYLVPVRDIQ